jgi:hypothetical protein
MLYLQSQEHLWISRIVARACTMKRTMVTKFLVVCAIAASADELH